jgi:hypothetical protein
MLEGAMLKDENGMVYYNISTPGIVLAKDSKWDSNGFAIGVIKCSNEVGEYEHWITVRVYNDLAQ